jgi:uncharacterized protein with von Willebrand factor type A (vWA) domain
VSEGKLSVNVMHFARVLRAAGLRIGPADIVDALRALAVIDITRKEDFRACLRAVFVRRHDQLELFEQAFRLFFRDPLGADQILSLLLPHTTTNAPKPEVSRRVAEALHPEQANRPAPPPPEQEKVEIEAVMAWSEREALRTKDFAAMSAEELLEAKALIARMVLDVAPVTLRRTRPAQRGSKVDVRATLRSALRAGSHDIPLRFRERRRAPPPLVLLCDISGSMSRYTEMLLRFLHLLVNDREKVACFVFGTRLHNVTRALRHRDVDQALARCGVEVDDWSGGTRIGPCLEEFNLRWSRRVLGQGAVVVLISDGLDRSASPGLAEAAARLHRSCRRLIWLNPLLSFAGFEPKASGIRAILPHVDEFRPVHNLESLEQLARALGTASGPLAKRTRPALRREAISRA